MIAFFRRNKIEVLLFVFALVLRVALFGVNLQANGGNFENTIHGSDWYFEVAKNVASGNGFSIDGVVPSPIHVPIYPYFLASSLMLFGSFGVALFVQLILGACIPILGKRLSSKLIPGERVGLFVGVCLALEPNLVLFSSIFFTETLFIFFFLLFLLVFIAYLDKPQSRLLTLSAFLLGISTLTKTATEFLPILLVPLLWWFFRSLSWKRILAQSALFVSVFILVLTPWLYRNYAAFGVPGMTIMPTLNLYATLVPSVLMTENHTSFGVAQRAFINDRGIDMRDLTFKTAPRYTREALSVLFAHPVALIKVCLINIFTFFTHDGVLTVLQNAGITPDTYLSKSAIELFLSSPIAFMGTIWHYLFSPFVLVFLLRLFWISATILFFSAVVLLLRRRKMTAPRALALTVVFYFALATSSNGLTVNARFRVPVEPLILTLACYPILFLKKHEN